MAVLNKLLMICFYTWIIFVHICGAEEVLNYRKWKLVQIDDNFSITTRNHILSSIENLPGVKVIESAKGHIKIGVGPTANNMKLKSIFKQFQLNPKILSKDIGKLIQGSNQGHHRSKRRTSRAVIQDYHFDSYMNYDQMEQFFDRLEKNFPGTIQRKIVGKSFEGRNISLFIITSANLESNRGKYSCDLISSPATESNRLDKRHVQRSGFWNRIQDRQKEIQDRRRRRLRQRRLDQLRHQNEVLGHSQNGQSQNGQRQKWQRQNEQRQNEQRQNGQSQKWLRQNGGQRQNGQRQNLHRQIGQRQSRQKRQAFEVGKNATHNFLYLSFKDILKGLWRTREKQSRKNKENPIIFIDAGVHAREWVSPAAALYLIKKLTENPYLTQHIDWYIMPLANPDGYRYSWKKDRFWRKSRSKSEKSNCHGADINRNFNHYWGEVDTSTNPCSEHYGGAFPGSEAETLVIENVILKDKARIMAYITLHNWGQDILYPYCYNRSKVTQHKDELERISQGMAEAIKETQGKDYRVGQAASLLYPASGTSVDWAFDVMNIPYSFLIELRDKFGLLGFLLPDSLIRPTGEDLFAAMRYLASQVSKKNKDCF